MSGLLPSSPDVSADPDPEPRVIGLESDDASDMLAALSSETARTVLSVLHEEPATPSALADRVDTSLQNVQYHLEKLERAELIEEVGTQYSEKGREMSVYGPADGPLVVFPGSDEEASGLRKLLRRAIAAVLVLGAASALIEAIAREWIPGLETADPEVADDPAVAVDDDDMADAPDDAPDAEPEDDAPGPEAEDVDDDAPDDDPDEIAEIDREFYDAETAVEDPHWLVESVMSLPPGVLFFAGGVLVLAVLFGVWYWRS